MSNLVNRGWDLPGGHLEPGESPEEAVRREAMEEAGAVMEDLRVLGYEKISLGGPKPAGYPYPHPVSYQVFFYGRVKELRPVNYVRSPGAPRSNNLRFIPAWGEGGADGAKE